MNKQIEFKEFISNINELYFDRISIYEDILTIDFNDIKFTIDLKERKWFSENLKIGHNRVLDLNKIENWSVLMLILNLISSDVNIEDIELEKTWKLGHKEKGSLDIAVKKDGKYVWFIEVKKQDELYKYLNVQNKYVQQLFSYVYQEREVKWGSYYTYDFNKKKHIFRSVDFRSGIKNEINSLEDLFENWDQKWINKGFMFELTEIDPSVDDVLIKYDKLLPINSDDVKVIFNQFLTILRVHSVSDKSNAFDKMINLFIAKISDELSEGGEINISGTKYKAMKFQFIESFDDNISFLSRLNDLYRDGMKKYLEKDIIDYSIDELKSLLGDNKRILEIFEDLRLKKDNAFSFIEIFDDETFETNCIIVKDIVELFQEFQFKYNNRFQYLGDFFEELLNTSWKQEAGQFFTPMPLVDLIIDSLPIEKIIDDNIKENENKILPKAIDYACGSGHFLISYMDKVQEYLNGFETSKLTTKYKKMFSSYKNNPLSWASEAIFGIEKDYRLSKTTKVSTFLNGDGEAIILNGNGLSKFNSNLFSGTELYSVKNENRIFDFVIANPPYSVKGFMRFLNQEGIDSNDFEMINDFNTSSSEIEVLFIERTAQLLIENGIGVVVLPRSILASSKYKKMRDYILKRFEISAIFESGDITFSGTSTSPVILFLKRKTSPSKKYKIMIISSPKINFEDTKNEKIFLGYEFSSNKSKLGITLINDNLKNNFSPKIKKHLLGKEVEEEKYISMRYSNDIFINYNGETKIYPRFRNMNFKNSFILSEVAEYILEKDGDENLPYVEISGIERNKNLKTINKKAAGFNYCKKGDFLFSSLAGTKDKWKYTIANIDAKITNAVHILRFKDISIRDYFIEYLDQNKNEIFSDLQSLVDGFKITYAKISGDNLMKKIRIEK